MFQDLLLKKMLKNQGVPEAQINQLLEIIKKNPELFKKIAKETKEKINSGVGQQEAAMTVMSKYADELKGLK